MNKLLTIIIPTYNRAQFLPPLFELLSSELVGLESLVSVVVGDNASTDSTADVTGDFKRRLPSLRVIRHSENLGGEENFCTCLDVADSKFVWIIGDDDMPRKGVLAQLLDFLRSNDPHLIFMPSDWVPVIEFAANDAPMPTVKFRQLSQLDFATTVNVWMTFISGIIFNYEHLKALDPTLNIRRFTGTGIVQLGWVFPLLQTGSSFYVVDEKCVLATSGNTGGYTVLQVFGNNFISIVSEYFGRKSCMGKSMLYRHYVGFLPGLIWGVRFGGKSNFIPENGWWSLNRAMKGSAIFWLLLTPIMLLPKLAAYPFFVLARYLDRSSSAR